MLLSTQAQITSAGRRGWRGRARFEVHGVPEISSGRRRTRKESRMQRVEDMRWQDGRHPANTTIIDTARRHQHPIAKDHSTGPKPEPDITIGPARPSGLKLLRIQNHFTKHGL